jgi:hypothetical protein
LCDADYFTEAVLGGKLHPGQIRWLTRSTQPENILITGNRWGKSFVCAVKILHRALYRIRKLRFDGCGRYRVACASITQDQANIIFNQVVRFINQSDLLGSLVTEYVHTPYPRIAFGNGSSIEARSTQNRGEYLLGNDYDYFVFDEVAFETDPEYVVEEVIQMRLADRHGMLDLVSTPNGKNWFYRRVRDITNHKRRGYFQYGDSRENPHLSREFLDDRMKYFSERRAQQNIMGRFVDTGGEILRGADIDRALKQFGEMTKIFETAEGGRFFLSGWDLARKKTATVGITVEVAGENVRVVQLERMKMFDWNVVIDRIKMRQQLYPGRLVVDATGLGDVVAEQLREYRPETVIFTPSTKAELLTNLELMHARGQISYERWELPDGDGKIWSLEDELRQARWDDNNQCDALMALALAVWPLRIRQKITPAPRVGRV